MTLVRSRKARVAALTAGLLVGSAACADGTAPGVEPDLIAFVSEREDDPD